MDKALPQVERSWAAGGHGLLTPGASCQNFESLVPEFPALKLYIPKSPASTPQGPGIIPRVQGDPSSVTRLHRPDPASLSPISKPIPNPASTGDPHLLPRHRPLPSSWPSGCQQGHLKIHVSIFPPHLKPPLTTAPKTLQSPTLARLPSSPLTSFTPSAPAPGRPASLERGNPTQPQDPCTCCSLSQGYSASHTLPPPPRSPPCPPWLE